MAERICVLLPQIYCACYSSPSLIRPMFWSVRCVNSLRLISQTTGLPNAAVQRSLTLIAKVIQSLANLNAASLHIHIVYCIPLIGCDRMFTRKSSCAEYMIF